MRQYSNEDCLEAIQRVTDEVGESPTIAEYEATYVQGEEPSIYVIKERFGSWTAAKEESGVKYHGSGDPWRSQRPVTPEKRAVSVRIFNSPRAHHRSAGLAWNQ